jgi:archaellum component FlaC
MNKNDNNRYKPEISEIKKRINTVKTDIAFLKKEFDKVNNDMVLLLQFPKLSIVENFNEDVNEFYNFIAAISVFKNEYISFIKAFNIIT